MNQISALTNRYLVCYFRVPGHFGSDFMIGMIIGGSLALFNSIGAWGALLALTFIFLAPFTYMGVTRTMLGEIVLEKTMKLKEFLKLNGVSDLNYQLYCMMITFFKVLIYTSFMIIGAIIAHLTSDDGKERILHFDALIILYLLSGFGTIGFILVASTFFRDAKYASDLGGFLYVVISLCSFTVFLSDQIAPYLIICLFPQCALTLGLVMATDADLKSPITFGHIYGMLIFDTIVYILLYMYLDQVVDDGNGVKKQWLFCLSKNKRRNNYSELNETLIDEATNDNSSALYHEKMVFENPLRKSVEVKGISKLYGDFKAVDDVSFPMYPGQILSLLGHNGAGKTTTINILAGVNETDAGMIYYEGLPFYKNLDKIRSKLGLCCQGDILFPDFSVSEHLELIAKLRNIDINQRLDAINQAATNLNLLGEMTKYSQYLSGGNKRKLSLAMAILGNTKVVFLDEPTSGMDPQNRRMIWEHIRYLKSLGLTILMTTHHLDEADELSDRIAIMARGKLLALGSSEFIKKSFGTGYFLTVTSADSNVEKIPDELIKKVEDVLSAHIPGYKRDEQTSSQVLKYLLPFTTQKKFPAFFEELEKIPDIKISLQMNSLEDTFVNIGLKEDELFNQTSSHQEALNLDMPAPACFSNPPSYTFYRQFTAIFKRKQIYSFRAARNVFLIVLPALVMIIGLITQLAVPAEVKLTYFDFFQTVAYALHTASYCAFPVYEREENLKYAMDVMGLRPLPYWIGTLVFDMITIFFINLVQFICYSIVYSQAEVMTMHFISPLHLLLISIPFSFAMITFAYMWSFIFSKSLSAVKYYPLLYYFGLNIFATMIVYTLILRASGTSFAENNTDPTFYMKFLFGLLYVVCPSNIYSAVTNSKVEAFTNFFLISNFLEGVAWLICTGLIYFAITIRLETRRNTFKEEPPMLINEINQQMPIDYQEIGAEAQRTVNSQNDEIKVIGLEKQYRSAIIYNALKGITFGVRPGEIFGLLGPNGAGKSTTFNILTALIPKTRGSVTLLGREVNRNMPDIYQHVGVCPQFNCLWDVMTVREHLEIFGGLKGYPKYDIETCIRYFADILSLGPHLEKRSVNLSGGNKRKLCVANCLIGAPKLMFFDEPSSGLDPLAKRFLWNSLQQSMRLRNASIVLTTHSMTEAESLAHKTGILINGKFFCIGPTENLKNKYGTGYKITLLLKEGKPPVTEDVLRLIPGSVKLAESFLHQETFQVNSAGFKFSDAFRKLEQLKERGAIKDFSIYNTTLEQVFLYFSRFQYASILP